MYHLSAKMSAISSPDPDFTKACALLKKKIEKSMRAPLDALPSTRMCFSGKCHPLGLTIRTACCNTAHNRLKQHVHDTFRSVLQNVDIDQVHTVRCNTSSLTASVLKQLHRICIGPIHWLCDLRAVVCAHKHSKACVHVLILTLNAGSEYQASVHSSASYLLF